MDFNSTVKGSALEGFYPAGWDFDKIDACVGAPESVCDRQDFWNKDFTPVKCESLGEFETYMGHEIAMQIKLAKERVSILLIYASRQKQLIILEPPLLTNGKVTPVRGKRSVIPNMLSIVWKSIIALAATPTIE